MPWCELKTHPDGIHPKADFDTLKQQKDRKM